MDIKISPFKQSDFTHYMHLYAELNHACLFLGIISSVASVFLYHYSTVAVQLHFLLTFPDRKADKMLCQEDLIRHGGRHRRESQCRRHTGKHVFDSFLLI